MKNVRNHYVVALVLLFCICGTVRQSAAQENALSPADRKIAADFEIRAAQYSKLREGLERLLPKLPKDATPEQIEAHKIALQKSVLQSRRRAARGAIFTLAAAKLIRKIIITNFKGDALKELHESVFEAETKGVSLKVNFPYPETKELVEMPPALLLVLPQLPKQLRYRFVGRALLLVDRENGLIIDYMTKALP